MHPESIANLLIKDEHERSSASANQHRSEPPNKRIELKLEPVRVAPGHQEGHQARRVDYEVAARGMARRGHNRELARARHRGRLPERAGAAPVQPEPAQCYADRQAEDSATLHDEYHRFDQEFPEFLQLFRCQEQKRGCRAATAASGVPEEAAVAVLQVGGAAYASRLGT